jgi:AraC-like DNA-binding protein
MNLSATRSVYNVYLMASVAAEHKLPAEFCLADTGISASDLMDPHAEVTVAQELGVIRNLVHHLGHIPGLGLIVGKRFHMSCYGVLAFALCSCATIRDVLQLGERYASLTFTLLDKRFEIAGKEIRVIFDDRHIPVELRRFVTERDFAALANIYNELFLAPLPGRRIELAYPEPEYSHLYQEFDIEAEFDAPVTMSACSISILDLPLPSADTFALRRCEAELDAMLQKRQARAGTAGKVRQILLRRLRQAPDMDAVASELHTTARTLRRLLDAEGVSFRALVDEVRQSMAEELLGTAGLSVKEVADRLGYIEIASFITAFRRWKGTSPGEWRNQHQRKPRPNFNPIRTP